MDEQFLTCPDCSSNDIRIEPASYSCLLCGKQFYKPAPPMDGKIICLRCDNTQVIEGDFVHYEISCDRCEKKMDSLKQLDDTFRITVTCKECGKIELLQDGDGTGFVNIGDHRCRKCIFDRYYSE